MSICPLAHPVIVRSPHAHARIVSVNKSAALASTGLLGEQGGMAVTVKEHDLGQVKAPVQHNLVDVSRPLRLRNAGKHDVERKNPCACPVAVAKRRGGPPGTRTSIPQGKGGAVRWGRQGSG